MKRPGLNTRAASELPAVRRLVLDIEDRLGRWTDAAMLEQLYQCEHGDARSVVAGALLRAALIERGAIQPNEQFDIAAMQRDTRLHNAMANYEAGIRRTAVRRR